MIYALQNLIMKITSFPIVQESTLAKDVVKIDNDLIGGLIESIILTPFVQLESNWLLAIVIFSLNIFTYYLVGWLIGSGFYRFGVPVGLFCIVIAFMVIYMQNLLLSIALDFPVDDAFISLSLSLPIAIAGTLVLAGITLWMIREMTKRASIKL